MTDYFRLLDEPRRPWPDLDRLKEHFLAWSAEVHPDRVHQSDDATREAATERYSDLNRAYKCLCEPKDRLLHLLELETGQKPSNLENVPSEMTELFFEVGRLCRTVDRFLAERERATSAILKAHLLGKSQVLTDEVEGLMSRVRELQATWKRDVASWNSAWAAAPPDNSPLRSESLPLARLEQAYRAFSYTARWTQQLRERSLQLSLAAL